MTHTYTNTVSERSYSYQTMKPIIIKPKLKTEIQKVQKYRITPMQENLAS